MAGAGRQLEDNAEEIIALVEEQRDLTLDEIVAAMHERRSWKPHGAVPLSGAPRHHIQKKSCTRASRSVRTWRAPAGAGYASKAESGFPKRGVSARDSPSGGCPYGHAVFVRFA